jgi:hypothetical protein
MWGRNLLFVGTIIVSIAVLRASLFPLDTSARVIKFDPGETNDQEFQSVVQRVDEVFRQKWNESNLSPALPADELIVARRLSLALTGSVPSLEDIRQFQVQSSETRVTGWANHLLRNRLYADYFADRLSRTYLGTDDGPLIVYRKRRFVSWLSDELLKNTPYSVLVREMVSGIGLNTDKPGVNFIAATYTEEKSGPDPEKLATRVSRAFLGLRLDCAQCHDHFLEPTWKQTHFQSLAAFFGQTRQVATVVTDGNNEYRFEDRKTGQTQAIDPAVPFLPELLPNVGTHREQLAQWLTDPRNVYFARATVNRVWAMMFNRPLLKRVEAQTLDEEHPVLDILATDFATHSHDLRRLILLIASTEAFRLDSAAAHITPEHERAWAAFPVTRIRPEQVIGSVIQAASIKTINQNSHVFVRLARYFNERDFVARYGEPEDDEFTEPDGTIPQRLLMMNGDLVNEKAREELLNASSQIAMFAPSDQSAVETAYLAVLSRKPTPFESAHFTARLAGTTGNERKRHLADLYWVLFNSSELSWNH